MVWNSNSSALYKAVELHNSGAFKTAPDNSSSCDISEPSEKNCDVQCGCNSAEIPQCGCDNPKPTCDTASKLPQDDSCTHKLPCNYHKNCCPRHNNTLDDLLHDKDFVLIAGLILLLLHEKADSKLILALAFVLFG